MLTVTYAEFHIQADVIYTECHLYLMSFILNVIYTECHLY
jgi:hypothetical protein